jgi:hypothetical protein
MMGHAAWISQSRGGYGSDAMDADPKVVEAYKKTEESVATKIYEHTQEQAAPTLEKKEVTVMKYEAAEKPSDGQSEETQDKKVDPFADAIKAQISKDAPEAVADVPKE